MKLGVNCRKMVDFYNSCVGKFSNLPVETIKKSVSYDSKLISWSRHLFANISRGNNANYDSKLIAHSLYRPFCKTNLYYSKSFNDEQGQIPKFFPDQTLTNIVIVVTGVGAGTRFSALMTDLLPDLHTIGTGQCFPFKLYNKSNSPNEGLFVKQNTFEEFVGSDGISDNGLQRFRKAYPNAEISKEDIFYYVYGLLHSPEYRDRFQNNLSKELPRIPKLKRFDDFKAFSDAGRNLGNLHVNYEKVAPFPVTYKQGDLRLSDISDPKTFYRVQRMKFAGVRGKIDKSTVLYNHNITITNIPLETYDYVVNGKSALDWVMDRQCVKTDKESGIVNDANDYANETVNNPAYPLELFQRVITVSLETMKIVRALPSLDID